MASAGPVRAFLSYAHEDSEWCADVLNHLGWLRHIGQVEAFHDRALKPGERWDDRIKRELAASEIVIALVSPHFMGSRYCCLDELRPAIARQDLGETDLVPIVCDHVDLGPLAAHQCLPQDENNNLKPLCDWPNPNLPLASCAAKVRALVEARRPPGHGSVAPAQPSPPAPASPPRAQAGLAGRLAAALGRGISGVLEGMLRTTLGTRATLPVPVPAPGVPPGSRPVPEDAGGPIPELFVGRQTDLDQLVLWLLDDVPQPIAVLGAGGIGKTTLTRAALRDARFADRFPTHRRLFVPLEDVRDAVGIHRAIGRALGIDVGKHPVESVLAALQEGSTLLVLDNAETPWEADRAEAESAFARLAAVSRIGLAASFRGFELPGGADWRPLIVEPLVADASQALFVGIAGDRFATDPALPTLLARLDGLPLAIQLVAHRAQVEVDIATVLRLWDVERTAFVRRGKGGRKEHDLGASIALSLASPRMTEPGRRLFALLGRLPHGLARGDLAEVMPADGAAAAGALTRTGLILRDTERLRMLAPVRAHAAGERVQDADAAALAGLFARLADALPWVGETPADPPAAAHARAELANIEAVLGEQDTALDAAGLARRGSQWTRVGDARQTLGSVTLASHAYLQAKNVNSTLTSRDPSNLQWQRDLSISWNRLGDVRSDQGDLPGALQAYTEDKNIADKLAAADPGNAQWQFDLGISNERVGNVLTAQGKLGEAAQHYQRKHDAITKLAAADPGNAEWQRDLSVSWNRLGDVRRAQGDLLEALAAYTESKSITDKLAAADPGNAQWQRDLIVSHWRLADLLERTSDRAGDAADHWSQALIRARALAANGSLAPTDAYFVDTLQQRLAAAQSEPDTS